MRPVSKKSNISVKQLFIVLSTGVNTLSQPWLPLISHLIDDALLQL